MKLTQKLSLTLLRTKFKLLSAFSAELAARSAFNFFCTPPTRERPVTLPLFAQAEKLGFELEGLKLAGYRWNPAGKQRILILHGFESAVSNFHGYIQELVENDFEVLAFDAPAHGRSEGRQITAPLYARMIRETHHRYGPVTNYIAHSFGCLSLALALEEMEHDSSYRVVWIAAASRTVTAIEQFFRIFRISHKVQKRFYQLIQELSGHNAHWYAIERSLPSISAGILWIHDEKDEITPYKDFSHLVEKADTGIQFHITRGLGHSRIYRDPSILKLVVDHFKTSVHEQA